MADLGFFANDNDRYRLLVDSITDYAIYMLDPQGHIASWNSGAARFKGYTSEEVLGTHFSRFYLPEDKERGLPDAALNAARQSRFEGEGWRVRKDGARFWAHVIIDPIVDDAGGVIGFAKVTRDLTERKQAEKQVRQVEQQFRLLVEGVTDYAIYMMDTGGRVSSWNAGAQAIKGYRPEEIIGQHFSKFFLEDDSLAGVPDRALEVARREGRYESEGWRLRKDGSRFWANAVIDAIRGDDGTLIGFAKITRDITEKMEADRALELAREELFQAQKMEAVGQLTGGVAHDFNNLLMAIQGSIELVKKRASFSPEVSSLLDNALSATHRGASLTQRLLAFSRRQELNIAGIDLAALIDGMRDMLQLTLGPTTVIETRVPKDLPLTRSDANQLSNALLNLALNSRDAMPSGGRFLIGAKSPHEVSTRPRELSQGEYVCLYVQDDGYGMDPQTLKDSTTPFFTTKGVGKGTGLGLSMVQGLVAQSGGALLLRSEEGKGTLAELWLPVSHSEGTTMQGSASTRPQSSNPLVLSILAVDDDPLVLMNTVMMLEDMGHDVQEAHSGERALSILDEGNINLVITDHAMPQMTGSQLALAMKERWPHIPIILATGYSDLPPGSRTDLLRLSKPFTEKQLEEAIRLVLE